MSDFFASHPAPLWYEETGPDHDIVISSKVKVSRNLSSFVYPHLLSEQGLEEACAKIETAVRESGVCPGFVRYKREALSETENTLLAEEGRIHRRDEFRRAAVLVSGSGELCVELNAKDHLCISSLRGGCSLRKAWSDVNKADSHLETLLDYAVSLDLGYLSSEIDNMGTALEASIVLHLPGVSLSGRLDKIEKILSETGFSMEPFLPMKGAGAEFFLVSGRPHLGESEEDIFKKFDEIMNSLLNYEREMRNLLFEKRGDFLEDQMSRAYGILERAKFLNCEEAVKLLSLLRMGYCLQRPVSVRWDRLTAMIFRSMPAHIRLRLAGASADRPLPAEAQEEWESRERAVFIHEELKKTSWGEEEGHCV
jgi:protein arginine kinase